MARKLAVEVGMGPENNRVGNEGDDDGDDEGGGCCPDSVDDNGDSWFYKAFKYTGMLSVDEEEVNDENELFKTDETDIDTPETRLLEDARLFIM